MTKWLITYSDWLRQKVRTVAWTHTPAQWLAAVDADDPGEYHIIWAAEISDHDYDILLGTRKL